MESSISDPRTGEIIKGHVSLGSLRIRQDFLIAQALQAPYANNDTDDDFALQMALARIRQLAAHEVGHTIGFTHNFAASTNDRASVMDYPHPKLSLKDGKIDFSDAYGVKELVDGIKLLLPTLIKNLLMMKRVNYRKF